MPTMGKALVAAESDVGGSACSAPGFDGRDFDAWRFDLGGLADPRSDSGTFADSCLDAGAE
jgi:hypothetical protein